MISQLIITPYTLTYALVAKFLFYYQKGAWALKKKTGSIRNLIKSKWHLH